MKKYGVLFLILVGFLGCQSSPNNERPSGNLIANKQPTSSQGVMRQETLNDGIASEEGEVWNSDLVSVFQDTSSFVVFDLGNVTPVYALYLQADNNDAYQIDISKEGSQWESLWLASPVPGAGMRYRLVSHLNHEGRFLRLMPSSGDGAYSVGEFQAFSSQPTPWPPSLKVKKLRSNFSPGQKQILMFGFAFFIAILIGSMTRVQIVWILPLIATCKLSVWIFTHWPVEEGDTLLLKAIVSFLSLVTLLRLKIPKRFPLPRRIGITLLALFAFISVSVYYHFGHFQFYNAQARRQTPVHTYDMRVYFPVAKYFEELRFDGLYLACLGAYLENHPHTTPSELSQIRLRSLTNNEIITGPQALPGVEIIKNRFSPERWEAFKKDMSWFEEAMSPGDYLGSMTDHGGNATPVWMWGAHLLFRKAQDIEKTLTLTSLLDPLLLILLFITIGRVFGIIPMLICMIVFGTTDFYRFGSNLAGSTLRQDWLVAMGLGVCLLRKEKYFWGGVLMAYAALIRAFPATAVFFLIAPAIWELITSKKLKDLRPLCQTLIGVVVCVVTLFTITTVTFSYRASWKPWFQKITLHADKPNVNHLGLRNLFSYNPQKTARQLEWKGASSPWDTWITTQRETLRERRIYFILSSILITILIFVACRGKTLYQSALFGLFWIPVIFYPANYYFHYVFLLPLLSVSSEDTTDQESWVFTTTGVLLLLMCAIHYFSLQIAESDVSFTQQSWILVLGFLSILGATILGSKVNHT